MFVHYALFENFVNTEQLSIWCLYPPERLMFLHFLPALFLALEWAVLWFGLDTVT